jgi:4'-phosphopantetheinyl transferase
LILVVHADPPEAVGRVAARSAADALLRAEVATWLGVPADDVTVGRLCPRCGSAAHGRPLVAGRYAALAPRVSVSRGGGRLVVALTDEGLVGVDVVSLADVEGEAARRTADALRLPLDTPESTLAQEWARVEAVLKATGQGLAVDPPEAGRVPDVHDSAVDVGPGLACHVAVLAAEPPGPVEVRAAPAAPRGTTMPRTAP